MKKNINQDRNSEITVIEPINFRSARRPRRPTWLIRSRWLWGAVFATVFVILSISTWFVFSARQVIIRVDPEPDQISIRGGMMAPRVGTYYLLRPGEYSLRASRQCYQPLQTRFQVNEDKHQEIKLFLKKLPGRLSIQVHPSDQPALRLDNAQVFIDDQPIGTTPLAAIEVEPGKRRIQIRTPKYQGLQQEIEIEGCHVPQSFDFALIPGWSEIRIASDPEGSEVLVNGKPVGKTPLKLELLAGTYQLELRTQRYKTWQTQLTVEPNKPQQLDEIRLQPADGTLALKSLPSDANVVIGEKYVGQTPLKIKLTPDVTHVVHVSKAGYQKATRKIKVSSAVSKALQVALKPKLGVIHFTVEPADAELFVNGKRQGIVPQQLRLIAKEHTLEIKKDGFHPYRIRITPRPGFAQEVKIALTSKTAAESDTATIIKAKNGYTLKLIRPKLFTMGSSRREQGRRSNETLRKVDLQQPFYIGVKEITNKEFREFSASHNSGAFKQQRLDADQQPVVRVSWDQAAMFCNWLSAKESLPPAYVKKGDTFVAAEPLGPGYRLPTEAEWEYCARFQNGRVSLKYPWGDKFPPAPQSGNFADESAKQILPAHIKRYHDGYPVSAPPAKFKSNELGLYDMGGNVAEWCHDYYSIDSYRSEKISLNPTGPKQGKHRVIKGSSWKHASISELRFAYRDYSDNKRSDLGFRVCRYLDSK